MIQDVDIPALADISLFDDLTVTFDATSNTLSAHDTGGGLITIATVNPDGVILAVGTLGDIFYVAGLFSKINGVVAHNIAWSQRYTQTRGENYYSQTTSNFRPVGNGDRPNGQINTLFCDAQEKKVWVGGRFTSPGRGVSVFDVETGVWSAPPFDAISGPRVEVTRITMDASNASLFFTGSFTTAFCYGDVWVADSAINPSTPNVQAPGGQALGFGFLEWARAPSAVHVSVEGKVFPHTCTTPSNSLSHDLLAALGSETDLAEVIINDVVHHPSSVIIIGGKFKLTAGPALGSSNIVAFRGGALTPLPGGGLNGEVTAFLLAGDCLYIGGAFDGTNDATDSENLNSIAMYNINTDTWSALDAGVDGVVASLTLIDGVLHVGANTTADASLHGKALERSPTGGKPTRNPHPGFDTGYTAWHTEDERWVKSGWPRVSDIGFVVGNMSFLGHSVTAQFVGGFRYRPVYQLIATDEYVHDDHDEDEAGKPEAITPAQRIKMWIPFFGR